MNAQLINDLATAYALQPTQMSLQFDGKLLHPESTLAHADLEDEDLVDVKVILFMITALLVP